MKSPSSRAWYVLAGATAVSLTVLAVAPWPQDSSRQSAQRLIQPLSENRSAQAEQEFAVVQPDAPVRLGGVVVPEEPEFDERPAVQAMNDESPVAAAPNEGDLGFSDGELWSMELEVALSVHDELEKKGHRLRNELISRVKGATTRYIAYSDYKDRPKQSPETLIVSIIRGEEKFYIPIDRSEAPDAFRVSDQLRILESRADVHAQLMGLDSR